MIGTEAQPSAGAQIQPGPKTVSQVLGEICWLMTQSQLHKMMFIADLEWMVMPPVLLEQFRIFYAPDGRPAGLALWGFVSKETEERLRQHKARLAPQEWRGGDNAWLIELIAPFGGQDEMLADLAGGVFKNKTFKYQMTSPTGTVDVVTHTPKTN